ncbi:MAG: hypothetical protein MAG453_00074 [Calditrichaeota bacterium]|nr:hypothetical protein [Calditrichota bacterium]
MSTPHAITNEGIGGGPFLTMTIDATANQGFSQDDIDANTTACRISGDNEVGKGAAGEKLFGKVVWVSTDFVEGTTRPATCAVQSRGVARFISRSPAPEVNGMVELTGDGKLRKASSSTDIPASGHLHRGQVIAVDGSAGTCDVWLG